jgi:deazaflavin-dependent oxidoreductase (nitroreductase family)
VNARRWFWRLIQIGPRLAYALGLGWLIGRSVLLLTTTGRHTGRRRVTPLVYDRLGEMIFVASARGYGADWLRNLAANPAVQIRVGGRRYAGMAAIINDPEEIADYLERQLLRNPRGFGAILRFEGLPYPPSRQDLIAFGPRRPVVAIRPVASRA